MSEKKKGYIRTLHDSMKRSPKLFALYTVLRILVIIALVRHVMRGDFEGAAICALSLVLFLLPALVSDKFRIEIPAVFQGIILVFIFAAEILGELSNFYVNFPGWDTMLHTLNGFLCAAIGFSLVDLLNRNSKNIKLSPFYLALVAFCFSMTVGVIWEFIECAGDLFFQQDMQKDFIVQSFQSVTIDPENLQRAIPVRDITETVIRTASGETVTIQGGYLDIGILDTMKDLFVNFIGAVVFCLFGYAYLKQEGKIDNFAKKLTEGMRVKPVVRNTEERGAEGSDTEKQDADDPDTAKQGAGEPAPEEPDIGTD